MSEYYVRKKGREGSRLIGTFSIRTRSAGLSTIKSDPDTAATHSIRFRIMSEKLQTNERSASVATANSSEQVPEWLGNRLRRMFTEVMDEPVPDEFKALLRQLEEKERGR